MAQGLSFVCLPFLFCLPPSPFYFNLVVGDLLGFHLEIHVGTAAFSDADRASCWMTKSSSGFTILPTVIGCTTQTSFFSCISYVHRLPGPDFMPQSIQIGNDLYIHFLQSRMFAIILHLPFVSMGVWRFGFPFGFDSTQTSCGVQAAMYHYRFGICFLSTSHLISVICSPLHGKPELFSESPGDSVVLLLRCQLLW